MKDDFSIDEIEGVIATIERSREQWHGHPGYARFLDIELRALHWLRVCTIESKEYEESQA